MELYPVRDHPAEMFVAQRAPLLLIDEITGYRPGAIAVRRVVRAEEPVFEGHFPGMPIVPGVYLVEMMAQASAALARLDGMNSDIVSAPLAGKMAGIEKARFFREVRPGDVLEIESQRALRVGRLSRYMARVFTAGAVAAEAVLVLLAPEEA